MITQSEARHIFTYHDGQLIWLNINPLSRVKIGSVAGTLRRDGYRQIIVNNRKYLTHRLVFLFHHGYLPKEIDHIDGCKTNNKIENLRPATRSQNTCNCKLSKANRSGIKGVHWHKPNKKWLAQLVIDGKKKYIGTFDDIKDAEKAVRAAREENHGQFVNHGTI